MERAGTAIIALCLGAAALALTLAAALAAAPPAGAAVWTAPSCVKVLPAATPAPTATAITLAAARNEYQAAQVVVDGSAPASWTLAWTPATDPLLSANAELFREWYVDVTQPSAGAGAKAGRYPDALLPATFGAPVALPAGVNTFYVRVHVPPGTPAGTYTGALDVADGMTTTTVPVSLRVFDFGWSRLSLHTSFPLSAAMIMRSVAAAVPNTPDNQATLLDGYYRFFADHGIAPTVLKPMPTVEKQTGDLDATGLVPALTPYLGAGGDPGLFGDTVYPLQDHWPWNPLAPDTSPDRLRTYLTQLFTLYRAQRWDDEARLQIYDEPGASAERETEAVARIAHDAADALGFRARLLVTDWPRTTRTDGRAANSFLFDDVDIWCPSVYRYFTAADRLALLHKGGAAVWWYTYATLNPQRYPTYLIDEPLTEERAMPWMTWRWDASGLLYWGTTRWGDPLTGAGYRDPYFNPASYAWTNGYVANGEASLIYPGYEPALGLDDPWAPPVSSLRMESLRDGIQDYEYLHLASRMRTDSPAAAAAAACAKRVAAAASDFRYGAYPMGYLDMPVWSRSPAFYDAARLHLADYIERARRGEYPTTITGTVRDAAGGAPVRCATVSDGVVSATTDAAGAFTLQGALPDWRLTVRHPAYTGTAIDGSGDGTVAVALKRSPAALLDGFEERAGFTLPGGTAARTAARSTLGDHSVRLSFRGAAAAVWKPRAGTRDLRGRTSVQLDVYDPETTADHVHPWFLYGGVSDKAGHVSRLRFLLRPGAWTHLSIRLDRGGLALRRIASVTLQPSPAGSRTVYVDTLIAR